MVCCLVNYRLKEEILKKACTRILFTHGGTDIPIFQELSNITLQYRRDLNPLLEMLHSRGIHYRWKFPFCLSASIQGYTALLWFPEGLQQFYEILNIPLINLPDWSANFCPTATRNVPAWGEPMEAQALRHQCQCSPSRGQSQSIFLGPQHDSIPRKSPQHQRTRQDH